MTFFFDDMSEAIGLQSLGSGSGVFHGGDTIIYDALVNGIGQVATLDGSRTGVNATNYNLFYVIASGRYQMSGGTDPYAGTNLSSSIWLYNPTKDITIVLGTLTFSQKSNLYLNCSAYASGCCTILMLSV